MNKRLMDKIAEIKKRDEMLETGEGLLSAAMNYKLNKLAEAKSQIVSGQVDVNKKDKIMPGDKSSAPGKGMESIDSAQVIQNTDGEGMETGEPRISVKTNNVAQEENGTESLQRDLSHDKSAADRRAKIKAFLQTVMK